jgi:hypothetical protein
VIAVLYTDLKLKDTKTPFLSQKERNQQDWEARHINRKQQLKLMQVYASPEMKTMVSGSESSKEGVGVFTAMEMGLIKNLNGDWEPNDKWLYWPISGFIQKVEVCTIISAK